VQRRQSLDVLGAILVTAGMLLLVYTLVEAPETGWGATKTVAGFAVASVILAIFAAYEARHRNPVFPFSIFRVRGLAAADVTMVTAMAGFYAMFFFITLYMQNVLKLNQLEAGAAYLGAAGIYWLSRIPVDGSYWSDLLPALAVTSLGLGPVLVGTTTAAQTGVSEDKAGLAAALINSSMWLGGALGIAIFSAVATSTTTDLLGERASQAEALTAGFQDALLLAAIFLAVAAVIAIRSPNTHGEQATPAPVPTPEPVTEAA
jgi:hypothetical protein